MSSQADFIFTQKPTEIAVDWTLLCGRADEMLRTLPDKSVRLFVTSPPYYRKFDYGHEDQCGLEETLSEYLEYQTAVSKEVLRVATDDANLFLVIQDSYNGSGSTGGDFRTEHGYRVKIVKGAREKNYPRKAQLLIPERLRIAFTDAGWIPVGKFIWDKTDSRRGAIDRASYSYEEILVFSPSPKHYWDREAVLTPFHNSTLPRVRRGFNYSYQDPLNRKQVFSTRGLEAMQQRKGAYLRSVLKINPGNQPKIPLNGEIVKGVASFPLLLAEICVNLGSAPGDLVCDPYAGMGTTLLAALKWGRNAIGIELNPQYCDAAKHRLKEAGFK